MGGSCSQILEKWKWHHIQLREEALIVISLTWALIQWNTIIVESINGSTSKGTVIFFMSSQFGSRHCPHLIGIKTMPHIYTSSRNLSLPPTLVHVSLMFTCIIFIDDHQLRRLSPMDPCEVFHFCPLNVSSTKSKGGGIKLVKSFNSLFLSFSCFYLPKDAFDNWQCVHCQPYFITNWKHN